MATESPQFDEKEPVDLLAALQRSLNTECGARIATAHPQVSQACALPVLHAGDHSPVLPSGAACCDLHNRNCEPPSELCCERCAEGAHPGHRDGSACITPDLSGNGTPPAQCQAKDFSGETWCSREVVVGRNFCWSHLPSNPPAQTEEA